MKKLTEQVFLVVKYTFISSLSFGTLLMIIFLVNKYTPIDIAEDVIIYSGLVFILGAIIINLIVLLVLIITWFKVKENDIQFPKHGLLLLANIPIACGYFYLLISLSFPSLR